MNIALNTYMQWLEDEEINRQQQVRTYRSYYEGNPPTFLTDRQRAFLNLERKKEFGANVCAAIVDTVVERLSVTGFTVTAPDMAQTDEELPEDEETAEDKAAELRQLLAPMEE